MVEEVFPENSLAGRASGLIRARLGPSSYLALGSTPSAVEARMIAGVDSGTKRNGLSKADLDVSAKLPEQRLERGEEAEAFPGRQVVGEDDLLQLGVAQRVEVEVARQVAP